MPDILSNIAMGFGIALTWQNIGLCLFGCVIGTAIGVLPGIGPLTTMAMILPVTFWLSPVGALIMLSGVFYGAQYGGSTTAILVKIPGETSSVITVLDGHAMAQAGRAGPALAIAALGSLFAGSVVTLLIAIGGPPLAKIALLFQSADYVSVMLLGLVSAVVLAHGSVLKAIGMIVLGGHAGPRRHRCVDRRVPDDHGPRRSLRRHRIRSAVDGPVRVGGDHGQSRSRNGRRRAGQDGQRTVADARRSQAVVPAHGARHRDWNGIRNSPRRRAPPSRHSRPTASKRKISKTPERFGKGAIEGVAAPESANNAAAQACFIPMLSLGIPPNA
jgi:putative tricarboxylic transport membrane protein